MEFGPLKLSEAEGTYLAHSLKREGIRLKKGHRLTAETITHLRAHGLETVMVARLGLDDVHEQEAARRVAGAVCGDGVRTDPPFTGRVNLFADKAGLFIANQHLIDRLNSLNPAVTIATLPNFEPVEEGRMVATVKIIPFAAPESVVKAAEALGEMVRVQAFQRKKVALVATRLDVLKDSTMEKTRRVLEERLSRAGAYLIHEERVVHETGAIGDALLKVKDESPDVIVLFGASANVDEEDVGPAGLKAAGGRLHHFGMPVDPGNLLFLGDLDDVPVIGAPGCARSPAENGFDWVLNRVLAGLPVTRDEIMGLGVGGLLMEIVSRPQPREAMTGLESGKITAIVLAAGRSTRMGGPNKLLATIEGVPLVRRVVDALTRSAVDEIVVVTGHMAEKIEAVLAGCPVRFAHNADYAEGLSTSLKTGIEALDHEVEAAMIALGDMPFISGEAFDQVIKTYREREDVQAVVATANGKRGNPVLWDRRFFDDLRKIRGDTGARHLIGEHSAVIAEIELGQSSALDLDTQDALHAAGGELPDTL